MNKIFAFVAIGFLMAAAQAAQVQCVFPYDATSRTTFTATYRGNRIIGAVGFDFDDDNGFNLHKVWQPSYSTIVPGQSINFGLRNAVSSVDISATFDATTETYPAQFNGQDQDQGSQQFTGICTLN